MEDDAAGKMTGKELERQEQLDQLKRVVALNDTAVNLVRVGDFRRAERLLVAWIEKQ